MFKCINLFFIIKDREDQSKLLILMPLELIKEWTESIAHPFDGIKYKSYKIDYGYYSYLHCDIPSFLGTNSCYNVADEFYISFCV